jgi:hypothetical protein
VVSARPIRLLSHRQSISKSAPRVAHLVIGNPKLERMVTRVLKAVGMTCTTANEPPSETSVDVVVFDVDAATPENRRSMIRIADMDAAPALILLSEHADGPMLRDLASYPLGYNLLLKTGGIDNGDLLVTIRKLVTRDLFGIDKYLRWGSIVHSCQLHSSAEKNETIANLERFLEDIQCDPRYVSDLANVADGEHHLYSLEPRQRVITLPETSPAAIFEYGSDGRNVAIGCRDPFGSLELDHLLTQLAERIGSTRAVVNRGPGGAGIGLYTSYRSLDHMIINLEPDVATEFLGIIDVSHPYREHLRSPRSLNVFTLNPFCD